MAVRSIGVVSENLAFRPVRLDLPHSGCLGEGQGFDNESRSLTEVVY